MPNKDKTLDIDFKAGIEVLSTLSEIQDKINEEESLQAKLYLLKGMTELFYGVIGACNSNIKKSALAFVAVAEEQLKKEKEEKEKKKGNGSK